MVLEAISESKALYQKPITREAQRDAGLPQRPLFQIRSQRSRRPRTPDCQLYLLMFQEYRAATRERRLPAGTVLSQWAFMAVRTARVLYTSAALTPAA